MKTEMEYILNETATKKEKFEKMIKKERRDIDLCMLSNGCIFFGTVIGAA